jgi:hypothetical protein
MCWQVQDKGPCQLIGTSPWLRDVLACAGQGPYSFIALCWTCEGSYSLCSFSDITTAFIWGYSWMPPTNLTSVVTIPGRGTYRLAFWLQSGGRRRNWVQSSNSWRAIIESVDRSFSPIVVDTLTNVPYLDATYREMHFQIPTQTTAVLLKFEVREVRPFLYNKDELSR